MEEITWQDRKARVREAYLTRLAESRPTDPEEPLLQPEEPPLPSPPRTIRGKRGAAAPPAATRAARSEPAAASAPPGTTATPATVTAPPATPASPPSSGTPAESTSPSSVGTTAWMASPIGFVEANLKRSIVGPNGSLQPGLPATVQSSLVTLATGRCEPVEDVVQQIVEWFIEEEDDRIETMTLGELVTFYMESQFV